MPPWRDHQRLRAFRIASYASETVTGQPFTAPIMTPLLKYF